MSGRLFVVATPIGNLEDITVRAVRVLREAAVIAAEDTRRTAKLLAHYGISTPTISFHQHNRRSRLPQLIGRVGRGENVALVSDAGTPGISDPGVDLVRACLAEHLRVEPVPGPSAPLAAAMASGFTLEPFTVFGFPPTRGAIRKTWLEAASAVGHTFSFFEAPHRIRRTMEDLRPFLGDRPIVVARELTKVHEEIFAGTTEQFIGQTTDSRGEFTVVVGPLLPSKAPDIRFSDRDIARAFDEVFAGGGISRRQAAARVGADFGRTANEVYAAVERDKAAGVE